MKTCKFLQAFLSNYEKPGKSWNIKYFKIQAVKSWKISFSNEKVVENCTKFFFLHLSVKRSGALFLLFSPIPPPPAGNPRTFPQKNGKFTIGSGGRGCRRSQLDKQTETDNARRTDKQIFSWTLARLCIAKSKMAKDLTRMPSLSEVDLSGLSEWEKSSITSVMEKAQVSIVFTRCFIKLCRKIKL